MENENGEKKLERFCAILVSSEEHRGKGETAGREGGVTSPVLQQPAVELVQSSYEISS